MSDNTPETKQTPKQRVLAVYPNAMARRVDGDPNNPNWEIFDPSPTASGRKVLGGNGTANGAWKNAATQLPSSGRSEYDDPFVNLDVTYPGGPPPVVFGPNDSIENADPKVGDVVTFRGDEGGALSISQSQEARERAAGRVNGFSKLLSDSTRQPMHKTSRQLERKATRDAHGYVRDRRTGTITRK